MPLEAGRNGMLMTDLRVDGSSRPSKDDIRRKMLQLRSNILGDDHKRRSSQVMQLVMADEEYSSCSRVLAYMPIRNEVSTEDLLSHALGSGKALYLPRVVRDSRELEIVRVFDLSRDLVKGAFGILEPGLALEPADQREIERIELAVIPGVAFDREGYRIGYGAGYFDRFLPRLSGECLTIGVCFKEQLVERLPRDLWDIRVKRVVSG